MCNERLVTEEEKHGVDRRLETNRAGEDLPTIVKTNLPMPWAIGKRFVILALTLLQFCGGAQALHLPIRGLPWRGRPSDSSTGAGRDLAAALGCVPQRQAAATPLRVVESKHNCTSLLTGGEMLQQRATLLHFGGGAQALHLPIRGLGRGRPSDSSTGAGRGLAAALGCVPLGQAAAPPLRIVENKLNCTSLLTGGEMLQQCAWTPQRALLQAGTGQDSSALLRN